MQTHLRAMAVRRSIVADFANEGLATLLKTMIQTGLRGTGPVQFRFAARPQVREADLTALWASLVEPLKRPERCPGAWRGLSWSLYRALVLEQALDPDDPGPFNVRMRAQLLAAYEDLRTAMDLWPRVLAFAERVPVRPCILRPAEAGRAPAARAS